MASTDPITWQLALAVQAQLQLIRKVNGYFTDIGDLVLLEESVTPTKDQIPVVVDVNTSRLSTDPNVNRRQRSISFTIEAAVKASLSNAKQLAHQIVGDVESAFSKPQASITGIANAKLTDSTILKRPDGLDAIVVQFNGTANYLPRT
ncbi:MAG: hypothetical protein J0I77_17820 [Rudaea sp.]|uniref:hypothetical protein n=1 Tax=unclassified Rudaea TaxID=2627037 RepID=UPI0010F8E7B3|nr:MULTISPECIES: hypothetical protein [unclassified Rudaea]MBN8887587.1 hypothetical protein [Rudaea sp.]